VDLQELDVVEHLLRSENLGNQHRTSDEHSDTGIRRGEQNARVRRPAAAKRR
jgi:hypothetical protein